MMDKYLNSKNKNLVDRLYNALKAGNEAGGDRRGIFSASILIVCQDFPPISLRVDYSSNPLKKLKVLIEKLNTIEYNNWLNHLPTISDPYKFKSRDK